MGDGVARTCITSPPYWKLRDYGVPGQLGMEKTPAEFCANLVEVFREVKRVLTNDGTLWIVIGDTHAGSWGAQGRHKDARTNISNRSEHRQRQIQAAIKSVSGTGSVKELGNLKPKDLVGIPWRLALALQDDGWWLRSDIIWHKPSPLPEGARDRPTRAHEYVFLLSKSRRYFYDWRAIEEPAQSGPSDRKKMRERRERLGGKNKDLVDPFVGASSETNVGRRAAVGNGDTRNKRTVWTVASQPMREKHYATYPPKLIVPCVLAGSQIGDTVLDPFMGVCTTALVAEQHGRTWLGCELSPDYARLGLRRLARARRPHTYRDDADHHSELFSPSGNAEIPK